MRRGARALIVGVGGLGCPAALALARSGVGVLGLCDDDDVETTNLHRQILFGEADVGTKKLDAAARALTARALNSGDLCPELRLHRTRLLPHNAVSLVREYDVVLEGSDNFATKFLTADACRLAGVPVVHASAVRWIGTALAVGASGRPCYRCLFEDVPLEDAPNCSLAGVMGPVVGIVATVQVDLALALLDGVRVEGQLASFDGLTDTMRRTTLRSREGCALCGRAPTIRDIDPLRYVAGVGYVAADAPACLD